MNKSWKRVKRSRRLMGRRTTLKRNLEKIERTSETYSNHYLVVLYIYSCEKMYAFPNLAICRYSNFTAPPEGSDYGFLRSVISPCEQECFPALY